MKKKIRNNSKLILNSNDNELWLLTPTHPFVFVVSSNFSKLCFSYEDNDDIDYVTFLPTTTY